MNLTDCKFVTLTYADVWSAGCVLAELLLGQPIFPGDSGVDQLVEIIKVLGTPTREQIREMNPNYQEFKFPQIKAHPWQKVSPSGYFCLALHTCADCWSLPRCSDLVPAKKPSRWWASFWSIRHLAGYLLWRPAHMSFLMSYATLRHACPMAGSCPRSSTSPPQVTYWLLTFSIVTCTPVQLALF